MAVEFRANKLLSALPGKEYQNLKHFLEPVKLSAREVLLKCNEEPKFLYFPLQGIVCAILDMENGATTETGFVGREGMVGTLQFIGQGVCHSYSVVQIEGTAARIEAEALRAEFDRSTMLQKLLFQYALMRFNQVNQIAACNNHHTVKQRTASCLLRLGDRYGKNEIIPMTHQMLSRMLGVRRTGITLAAKEIQQQGIIDYCRGKIQILDRSALEEVACECYQVGKFSRK